VVRIEGLPAGDFDIHAWHYAQDARPAPIGAKLRADENASATFTVGRRPLPPRPTPK
jgi:hypothetical protein